MLKYVSYLSTGLNLLLRLLLWLLGNHDGCHILGCILGAHWLLMVEWEKYAEHFREQFGCGSKTLRLLCGLTWLLMDDLRWDVISTAETDWWPGVLRSPWIFIWDAEDTEWRRTPMLNWSYAFALTCWLTGGVGHRSTRGFAWAARWRWRCPTVVEAVENLLQAGGVELGLGAWILGLLWWYEDIWALNNSDSTDLPGKVSPFLLSCRVGILLYQAPCGALLLLQHSCRVEGDITQTLN